MEGLRGKDYKYKINILNPTFQSKLMTKEKELSDIIIETQKHIQFLQDRKIEYISGVQETSFALLMPNRKRFILEKEARERANCKLCKLYKTRKKVVYGEGNSDAELMFIGEGPGENEDKTGRPFVGRAGQLLDKIIKAMRLERSEVYIANIVKCRPPNNRNPEADEIQTCRPFLDRQIDIIKPKVIITLGAPASRTILNTTETIGRLRGKFFKYKNIPVLPTYHPSYLLRNPESKKASWKDVQIVMKFLNL